MLPSLLKNGYLPPGRYLATVQEIESAFMYNDQRQGIWNDFKTLCQLVLSQVDHISWIWLGGSFFSNKDVPGDIDVVFFIQSEFLIPENLSDIGHKLMSIVAMSRAAEVFGLKVDSYIVAVDSPKDACKPDFDSPQGKFLGSRGYWDNLWSAQRSLTGQTCNTRGYLEVIGNVL